MRKLVRRGLLFIVFLLLLQLLVGVTTASADPGYHVVRPGETLFSIGRLYGVNPYTIASMNGLANPNAEQHYVPFGAVGFDIEDVLVGMPQGFQGTGLLDPQSVQLAHAPTHPEEGYGGHGLKGKPHPGGRQP